VAERAEAEKTAAAETAEAAMKAARVTAAAISKKQGRRSEVNALTTTADGDQDAQLSFFESTDSETLRELKILNPYAGFGLSLDDLAVNAMGDLGLNIVRREDEHCDLALGWHMDTGVTFSKETTKLYFAGFGGEIQWDKTGNLKSAGLGIALLKLNAKLSGSQGQVSEDRPRQPPTTMPHASCEELPVMCCYVAPMASSSWHFHCSAQLTPSPPSSPTSRKASSVRPSGKDYWL